MSHPASDDSAAPSFPLLHCAPSVVPMTTAPAWLRRAVPDAQSLAGKEIGDIAITVGAAIGTLDAVLERWAGAWRSLPPR